MAAASALACSAPPRRIAAPAEVRMFLRLMAAQDVSARGREEEAMYWNDHALSAPRRTMAAADTEEIFMIELRIRSLRSLRRGKSSHGTRL